MLNNYLSVYIKIWKSYCILGLLIFHQITNLKQFLTEIIYWSLSNWLNTVLWYKSKNVAYSISGLIQRKNTTLFCDSEIPLRIQNHNHANILHCKCKRTPQTYPGTHLILAEVNLWLNFLPHTFRYYHIWFNLYWNSLTVSMSLLHRDKNIIIKTTCFNLFKIV